MSSTDVYMRLLSFNVGDSMNDAQSWTNIWRSKEWEDFICPASYNRAPDMWVICVQEDSAVKNTITNTIVAAICTVYSHKHVTYSQHLAYTAVARPGFAVKLSFLIRSNSFLDYRLKFLGTEKTNADDTMYATTKVMGMPVPIPIPGKPALIKLFRNESRAPWMEFIGMHLPFDPNNQLDDTYRITMLNRLFKRYDTNDKNERPIISFFLGDMNFRRPNNQNTDGLDRYIETINNDESRGLKIFDLTNGLPMTCKMLANCVKECSIKTPCSQQTLKKCYKGERTSGICDRILMVVHGHRVHEGVPLIRSSVFSLPPMNKSDHLGVDASIIIPITWFTPFPSPMLYPRPLLGPPSSAPYSSPKSVQQQQQHQNYNLSSVVAAPYSGPMPVPQQQQYQNYNLSSVVTAPYSGPMPVPQQQQYQNYSTPSVVAVPRSGPVKTFPSLWLPGSVPGLVHPSAVGGQRAAKSKNTATTTRSAATQTKKQPRSKASKAKKA
jgi:hypothetical protein